MTSKIAQNYLRQLDEQFVLASKMFVVALFPRGWNAMCTTDNNASVCVEMASKAEAIHKCEEYAGAKYDPTNTHYL